MFIATLFTDPQEEPTWNEKIEFFKVLAGESAQQKQVPNRMQMPVRLTCQQSNEEQ